MGVLGRRLGGLERGEAEGLLESGVYRAFLFVGPLPKEKLRGTIHLEAKVQSKLTHRGFTFNPCRHQGHTLTP